jgi:basic membrane protein A and related proteins
MRRWTKRVGLVLVALAVAQCSTSTTRRSATPPAPTTTLQPPPTVEARGATFDACMVTDVGGINDRSFNASAYQGLEDARNANPGIRIHELQATAPSDYDGDINTFIQAHCGIIVTVGYPMGDASESAARSHPNQDFAIVDDTSIAPLPNVKALVFNTAQAGFLGGYLAAGMSRTGFVATFGGQRLPPVTTSMDGFWEGVQYYDGAHHTGVKVFGWDEESQSGTFDGSFTDQAKAAQITQAFVQRGADVIFPVAGGAGLGAAAAVQRTAPGVHLLWVDADGCVTVPQYCDLFLTSVTKGIAAAVAQAIAEAAAARFEGGEVVGTLANGGVGLAPLHALQAVVPPALQQEVEQVRQAIIGGSLTISSPSQPG